MTVFTNDIALRMILMHLDCMDFLSMSLLCWEIRNKVITYKALFNQKVKDITNQIHYRDITDNKTKVKFTHFLVHTNKSVSSIDFSKFHIDKPTKRLKYGELKYGDRIPIFHSPKISTKALSFHRPEGKYLPFWQINPDRIINEEYHLLRKFNNLIVWKLGYGFRSNGGTFRIFKHIPGLITGDEFMIGVNNSFEGIYRWSEIQVVLYGEYFKTKDGIEGLIFNVDRYRVIESFPFSR